MLDEKGEPIACNDIEVWAKWFQSNVESRSVKATVIEDITISTVFLGLDHGYNSNRPVLWETLVFEGPLDQEMNRCTGSREQAEAMHAEMVEKVKQALAAHS